MIAEAGDVADAPRYVHAHRPSVVVLNLNMPGEESLPAMLAILVWGSDPPAAVAGQRRAMARAVGPRSGATEGPARVPA